MLITLITPEEANSIKQIYLNFEVDYHHILRPYSDFKYWLYDIDDKVFTTDGGYEDFFVEDEHFTTKIKLLHPEVKFNIPFIQPKKYKPFLDEIFKDVSSYHMWVKDHY